MVTKLQWKVCTKLNSLPREIFSTRWVMGDQGNKITIRRNFSNRWIVRVESVGWSGITPSQTSTCMQCCFWKSMQLPRASVQLHTLPLLQGLLADEKANLSKKSDMAYFVLGPVCPIVRMSHQNCSMANHIKTTIFSSVGEGKAAQYLMFAHALTTPWFHGVS